MKQRFKIINYITLLLFVISTAMTGCSGQKSQKPNQQMQQLQGEQQGDKIPEQLKKIETGIESIIRELNGPALSEQDKSSKEGSQQEGESAGGQSGSKDSQGSGKEEKKSGEEDKSKQGDQKSQGNQQDQGSQQGQQTKQPPKKDPWQSITTEINNMHYEWNSYMPIAAKMGANKTLMDNFSKALNSLTTTIVTKNATNTQLAASYLYAYIPDFYSLYRTGESSEIKRIRYYTRNAMLNSLTANWKQADYDINTLKSSWSLFKNTISKEQQDISNKLDFSIYELDKVIKERNQPLIDIKGRVAMSNIEAFEKSMEKAKKGGGGSEGGQEGQSGGGQSGGGGGQSGGGGGQSGGGGGQSGGGS